MLYDFFPILLFFIAYKVYDIYVATALLIAASFVQTFAHRIKHGSFENTHLITLALVTLFGGATLLLQDETFIKWKPSVINWLFGIAFLGSQFIGEKPLVQRMLSKQLELPSLIWKQVNLAWAGFFIAMGFINLYVVYNFDTDTWVNFKLFGMFGLTLIFMFAQGLWLSKYMQVETDKN